MNQRGFPQTSVKWQRPAKSRAVLFGVLTDLTLAQFFRNFGEGHGVTGIQADAD